MYNASETHRSQTEGGRTAFSANLNQFGSGAAVDGSSSRKCFRFLNATQAICPRNNAIPNEMLTMQRSNLKYSQAGKSTAPWDFLALK
jgi:hypothetical protein